MERASHSISKRTNAPLWGAWSEEAWAQELEHELAQELELQTVKKSIAIEATTIPNEPGTGRKTTNVQKWFKITRIGPTLVQHESVPNGGVMTGTGIGAGTGAGMGPANGEALSAVAGAVCISSTKEDQKP